MIQQKQACVRGPNDGFPQVIYIAPMSDPWTIDGARHEVAAPELAWEEARIRPDSTRSTALVCYGGTGRRPMCRSAIGRSARGAPPCVPLRRRSLRVAMASQRRIGSAVCASIATRRPCAPHRRSPHLTPRTRVCPSLADRLPCISRGAIVRHRAQVDMSKLVNITIEVRVCSACG